MPLRRYACDDHAGKRIAWLLDHHPIARWRGSELVRNRVEERERPQQDLFLQDGQVAGAGRLSRRGSWQSGTI